MKEKNNSLKENTLFNKVKSWLYGLFHKSKRIENEVNYSNSFKLENNNEINYDFFEEYKEKSERRQYLLALQRKYKNKEIFEKDINEQDRNDLKNLYIEQNTELKRKIQAVDFKIAKASK